LLLVLSNVANESARQLVEMFPSGAASLVTASNLNVSFKAAVRFSDFAASKLTIGGVPTSASEISGVVSTIAYFLPQEFYYIEPADREYVCAEVSAFFIYFLSQLRCKKLNPSTSKTLCGLGLNRIEWMKAARDIGVPVEPACLRNGLPQEAGAPQGGHHARATCIGGEIVEDELPDKLREYLCALSQAFSMPYLCADFASPRDGEYLLAGLWSVPDVTVAANREAIVRFMQAS
jgi:hypothetical protein